MNDLAISIILDYVNENLIDTDKLYNFYLCTDEEFKTVSYKKWAAYEICNRIADHPMENPSTVIEMFMLEMSVCYTCYSRDDLIYQSAYDMAEELLRLFTK